MAEELLLNMRDGCAQINNELENNENYDTEIQIESNHIPYENEKLRNVSSTKRSSKSRINPTLTFEEQKEIEEPIEIDLRNIYKTYGINPIDMRQKLFKKQSNDIINFSVGEAYMKYAHGKEDEAINLLFEVIRMNPLNSEPYDALGDIYRKIGNYHKALEFYLLGIEFNQNDSKRWAELAELAYFNQMYKSALQFYSRAIKISPRNITYYIKKSNLFEEMKHYDNAYKIYEKILSFLEPEDYKIILSIGFRIANLLQNQMNCPKEALNVIENIINQHSIEQDPNKFESFRLYLSNYFDLLLSNRQLQKLVFKFLQYDLIKFDDLINSFNEDFQEIDIILNNLNDDRFIYDDTVIKSKLICVCLYLNHYNNVVKNFLSQFEQIENENAQESVYRPLIPALMQLEQYDQAYIYVSKLVKHFKSSKYWFWCGVCLQKLSRVEEAIVAYENAIQHDPNNYDAVNELSDLCNQIGLPERALDKVHLNHLQIDIHLLINRCNLLFICKRWSEFIVHCRLLLSSNLYFIDNMNDINDLMIRSLTSSSLIRAAKTLRRRYAKTIQRTQLTGGQLTKHQFFSFWKKSIFVLINYTKEYEEAIRWAYSGLMSTFTEQLTQPILLIMFRTCVDVKSRTFTYDLGKLLLKEYQNSGKFWYAFSTMLTNIYQNYRHKRLCIRLWAESPDNVNILLMNGHIAFSSSRYIHALGIYLMIYRMNTSYRYDSFHVALTYMHLICQPHTMDKCSLFAQMIAFFHDYMQKIGRCQETYFNLARAFHQLGFIRYAIELYQVALQTPLKVHDKRFDLSPEIAYNLSQIYRNSGNYYKANELIYKYCTI